MDLKDKAFPPISSPGHAKPFTLFNVNSEFGGRHYETGLIANWMNACGNACDEATVLGASGGIAFGQFIFEYAGQLPHLALLTRNTFSPFECALDRLGVRRTTRESTKAEKGASIVRVTVEAVVICEVPSSGVITRIVLENFMSHTRTEIEPSAGLTVLTGPNNCGKSALVEALRVICHNPRGDYMIRHGAKSASVTLETDEGHVVTWKRAKSVLYTLNGEEVYPRNNGLPDDLHKLLRLPKVFSEDGKSEFDIHIAEQKNPIFLLNQPGSQAAVFFASSSDAAYLVAMQKQHKLRVLRAGQRKKDLTEEVQELDRELQAMVALDPLGEQLRLAEQSYVGLAQQEQSLEAFEKRLSDLDRRATEVKQLSDEAETIKTLNPPPVMSETERLARATQDLVARHTDLGRQEEVIGCLRTLGEPPTQLPTDGLERITQSLQLAHRLLDHLGAFHQAFQPLTKPPVAQSTEATEILINALRQAERTVADCNQAVQAAAHEHDAAAEAIRIWARENPTCPVCHSVVDPEVMLQHAASH